MDTVFSCAKGEGEAAMSLMSHLAQLQAIRNVFWGLTNTLRCALPVIFLDYTQHGFYARKNDTSWNSGTEGECGEPVSTLEFLRTIVHF